MPKKPSTFYKYQGFTPQSVGNLASSAVYFCSMDDFNDPFDCALETRVQKLTHRDVDVFRDHIAKEKGRNDPDVEAMYSMPRSAVGEILEPMLLKAFERLRQERISEIGVACFSETPHNTLMWSHYADKGRGFCLEFSTSAEMFTKVHHVEYEEEFPVLDGVSLLLNPEVEKFHRLIRTKSVDWRYEREWRAFHSESRTLFHYGKADLTGVYFGPKSTQATQNAVCLIARQLHPDVRFFTGSRSASKFRIEFQERQFSSKRKGE